MDSAFAGPHRRNRGFLGADSSALSPQDRQDRRQLRYQLDLNSFNARIFIITASGFLTDSYNLFATNVILTSINFVYFPHTNTPIGLIINLFTLLGSVIGQLLFGFLADYYGRAKLYGIELVLVIVSTIGVATSSHGYSDNSVGPDMSFLALFTWWRFVMGVDPSGIGAEYPLSSVITSEWSSTQSRTLMLSSVFLMQPIGQALAQLVGLFVLLGWNNVKHLDSRQCGLDSLHEAECKKAIDGVWRIVIGSGAAPALLAIIFRFFLYDCGLFTLEVKGKTEAAFRDTQKIYGSQSQWPSSSAANGATLAATQPFRGVVRPSAVGTVPQIEQATPVQFSLEDLRKFFIRDGNWIYLIGTSATWFFLDVSFYGFSLDNRGTLASLWATSQTVPIDENLECWNSSSVVRSWSKAENGTLPTWQTDVTHPCHTIYDVLFDQSKQYLASVSIASIVGSACFVVLCNKFHRRRMLTVSFLALALLFLITGGVYMRVKASPSAYGTVVMVAICHFAFNFGANTLTFIIPAEIFPTAYRSTCHGISAAAGKLGSILAVVIVHVVKENFDGPNRQGALFMLFATFMFFGALCSWAYLPDVQRKIVDGGKVRWANMTLEELGEGREKARREGQVITIKEKMGEIKAKRLRRKSRRRGESRDEEGA
ncbi:hypothetical protein OOU_Y34scaffold00567g26 [Pyricularia oryzae Y34]|uniref:Major facilitator superfamily (MFS) profile domain-containing protein n=2 Tax=Pyricularia oryzae TaxID=318829 RepID=A0AA97PKH0_PYRO3|nr:hypothetical protein OOU_Y34scaffold00567g26 [Pyricularia oryzae Y34]